MDQPNSRSEGGGTAGRTDYVVEESAWRVRDMPERLRPREEMERVGVRNVSDDVLLAIILRSGVRGANVISLARQLLRQYGSLEGLAAASIDEIAREVRGMGRVKAQVLMAALEIARRLSEEAESERERVRSPADVVAVLRPRVAGLEKEIFWVINVDAKNRVKGQPHEVSAGLLDASLVHPREVFREAIRSAAAAVVLAHNHPSGDATPSAEDVRITRQLVEAGRVVDIKVLDHVILGARTGDGAREFCSLREDGIVDFK